MKCSSWLMSMERCVASLVVRNMKIARRGFFPTNLFSKKIETQSVKDVEEQEQSKCRSLDCETRSAILEGSLTT